MTLVLLIRHGVTDQTGKRLYGRTPGILLSAAGHAQVRALGERLRAVPLEAVYTSPLERCVETARAVAAGRRVRPRTVRVLNEVDYGEWTGRSFPSLRRTTMWARVRSAPASVRFPGGESLAEVQARGVACIEDLAGRHPKGRIAVISHGDVIRLVLAHYAGIHLDLFQRLDVAPASLSAIAIGEHGPRIVRVNETGAVEDLASMGG